ncbi:hypothetical protein LDENG_00088060 [Lucifuga dentata]|nr:hypothetical protein LDENG_00088060 [Lucifuga dentata]
MATDFSQLTQKHGIKVSVGFPCSVDNVAIGDVGHSSIKSAARMNSAVVLFLDSMEKANAAIDKGITVNMLIPVPPLTTPAKKIVVTNVPQFISDGFLKRELSRHDKIVSPMKKVLSGCKSPLLKYVVSHRRQVYMILKNRQAELSLKFHVRVDDFDYILYAASETMRCLVVDRRDTSSGPVLRNPVRKHLIQVRGSVDRAALLLMLLETV